MIRGDTGVGTHSTILRTIFQKIQNFSLIFWIVRTFCLFIKLSELYKQLPPSLDEAPAGGYKLNERSEFSLLFWMNFSEIHSDL